MRVFITGAKGQLGKELVTLFGSETLHLASLPEEDVTDVKILGRIADFHPDLILHAAAMTDVDACEREPDRAFRTNALGARNVAVAAEKVGAKLALVSTDYVFDGNKTSPYIEYDPTGPVSVYGRSKLAGETMVREFCRRHFIFRTAWLYGKHGNRHFVRTVLTQAAEKPELRMVSDKVGTPTRASDLAEVIRAVTATELYGLYHASNEGETTWQQYAMEILKIRGIDKPVHPITMYDLGRPAQRPAYSVLRNFNLEQIGIRMRTWQAALKDFLENEYK
jgi:dTDP-4-dehydrorhamnose reductase